MWKEETRKTNRQVRTPKVILQTLGIDRDSQGHLWNPLPLITQRFLLMERDIYEKNSGKDPI